MIPPPDFVVLSLSLKYATMVAETLKYYLLLDLTRHKKGNGV